MHLRRIILAIVLTSFATSALALGLGREGARGGFGSLGAMRKSGTAAPVVCSPGNATGEMDFSKCSNVGITAALW